MKNLNDLTLEEIKELQSFLKSEANSNGLCDQIGSHVIIRTYSAGVWFGKLEKKSGNEVYLTEARRMYRWWAKESISLSGVAIYGLKDEKKGVIKICPPIERVWLEAIEILTLTKIAINSIKEWEDAKAE